MGQIISSSFADAWPLLVKYKTVYVILAILAALEGLLFAIDPSVYTTGPASQLASAPPAIAQVIVGAYGIGAAGGIAVWFVLAEVVRTIDPAFRMTVGRFFGLIGIGIVVGIVIAIGSGIPYGIAFSLFFAAFGQGTGAQGQTTSFIGLLLCAFAAWWLFFISMKWSQVTWAYLLGDPPNPFTTSWRATNGRFWQTLGFLIVVGILAAIILEIPGGILLWIGTFAPFLGILIFPAVFVLYVWVICFAYLAEARWYVHLRSRDSVPTAA
jgi:hypothetical protein